jgi:hypothetical protein
VEIIRWEEEDRIVGVARELFFFGWEGETVRIK